MLAHRKISNFVARGILKLISFQQGVYVIQGTFLAGEVVSDLQHPQEFGFASKANLGACIVAVFNGGNRDHGQAFIVYDPSVTPADLGNGDSCQYDASGNRVWLKGANGILIKNGNNTITLNSSGISITDATGNSVVMNTSGLTVSDDNGNNIVMNASGITVNTSGNPVTFNAPVIFNDGWTLNGGIGEGTGGSSLDIDGDITAAGQVSDASGSMQEMRTTYNGHNHDDPNGGVTGAANQQMN